MVNVYFQSCQTQRSMIVLFLQNRSSHLSPDGQSKLGMKKLNTTQGEQTKWKRKERTIKTKKGQKSFRNKSNGGEVRKRKVEAKKCTKIRSKEITRAESTRCEKKEEDEGNQFLHNSKSGRINQYQTTREEEEMHQQEKRPVSAPLQ